MDTSQMTQQPLIAEPGTQRIRSLTVEQLTLLRAYDANVSQLSRDWGLNIGSLMKARYGSTYRWANDTVPPCARLSAGEANRRRAVGAASRFREREIIPAKPPEKLDLNATELQIERRKNAIKEGGVERLKQLEDRLRDKYQLTETEWALLHRLRIGLRPKQYAILRAGAKRNGQD